MLEEGIVKSGSFNIDQGVGLRALNQEKTAFAYSDDISILALESAAEAVKAVGTGSAGTVPVSTNAPHLPIERLYQPTDPLASITDREKVTLISMLENHARSIDPVSYTHLTLPTKA